MEIGWMTDITEANAYFIYKRLETGSWDKLANDAVKTKALWNAYNRIYYCDDFNIPASPTTAQLAKLKDAQCEMTYFLAMHLADEDRRKGLQAQGVISAGIVKESYEKDMLDKLPIPPIVRRLLADFYAPTAPFHSVDIDRNEDKEASEDVTEF